MLIKKTTTKKLKTGYLRFITTNGDIHDIKIWNKKVITKKSIEKIFKNKKYDFSTCVETIEIPEGIKTIEEKTFNYLSKLTTVLLPNSLEKIGIYAFSNNEKLKNINLPDNIWSIGYNAFANTGIEEVIIPKNIVRLKEGTFAGCQFLTKVVFNEKIESILEFAFSDCIRLENIIFDKVKSNLKINKEAFANTGVVDLFIPSSITDIDEFAFLNCSKLKTIEIENKITSIATDAFYRCLSIDSIKINKEYICFDIVGKAPYNVIEELTNYHNFSILKVKSLFYETSCSNNEFFIAFNEKDCFVSKSWESLILRIEQERLGRGPLADYLFSIKNSGKLTKIDYKIITGLKYDGTKGTLSQSFPEMIILSSIKEFVTDDLFKAILFYNY